MSEEKKTLFVNNREIEIAGERNLLELIRKAGIDIPTFCYHSELSIYGACRLCLVDVKGRGIMASCSTRPEPGMVIFTDTKAIRNMRKINVELLLARPAPQARVPELPAQCELFAAGYRPQARRARGSLQADCERSADRRFESVAGSRSEQVRALRRLRAGLRRGAVGRRA